MPRISDFINDDWRADIIEENIWDENFSESPQTNLWMIDYLIQKAEITYDDFVKDPYILEKSIKTIEAKIRSDETDDVSTLLSRPGRCTSFSIKTARDLQEQFPNKFKFRFYDLGRHRLACCSETGLLIDSVSPEGAFHLEEDLGEDLGKGKSKSFDNKNSWKYTSYESTYEETDGNGTLIAVRPPRICRLKLFKPNLSANSDHRNILRRLQTHASALLPVCLGLLETQNHFVYFGMMSSFTL